MQLWTYSRQGQLERQLQNLSSQQAQLLQQTENRVASLERSMQETAEANRWVTVNRAEIEPTTTCESAQAKVDWSFQRWAEDMTARLLYRSGPDQPWQEATVQQMGALQSYAASFQVAASPVLRPGYDISYAATGSGKVQETQAGGTEEGNSMVGAQYQIIAQSPSMSQSSGVHTLPLHAQFVIPLKIAVDVERDGRYLIEIAHDPNRGPCAGVESIELRTFVGNELKGTTPLRSEEPGRFAAEWRSEEALSQLEIRVRYNGGEQSFTIPL